MVRHPDHIGNDEPPVTETLKALALLAATEMPELRDKCRNEHRKVSSYPGIAYESHKEAGCIGWTPTTDMPRIMAAIRAESK